MFVGIDCGTQGTKAVILDPVKKKTIGEGYAPHQLITGTQGRREQDPAWWVEALKSSLAAAIAQAKIDPKKIRAIGISGQQHGLVVLDKNGVPVGTSKLWCDTETDPQNEKILAVLGGRDASIAAIGNVVATGYTASKILWMRETSPALLDKARHIFLPHDYLNFWLTGEASCEYGDASGTGYFDVRTRQWSDAVLSILDPSGKIKDCLPPVLRAEQSAGVVRAAVAAELGLASDVLVASGGGDNMMGAIGTGNVKEGIITMGLGTSGTIYCYSATPPIDVTGRVATFCSSNNGWLSLICTMNVTSAVQSVQQLLSLDIPTLNRHLTDTPIGAQGLMLMPFFNGERTPALPTASASLIGATTDNFTAANLARATVEGASLGLRYGLELLADLGIRGSEIRLIGGGSKSPSWRQIVADMSGMQVVCPTEGEAGALGAALQALWCFETSRQKADVSLEEICNDYVRFDKASTTEPKEQSAREYKDLYARYCCELKRLYSV